MNEEKVDSLINQANTKTFLVDKVLLITILVVSLTLNIYFYNNQTVKETDKGFDKNQMNTSSDHMLFDSGGEVKTFINDFLNPGIYSKYSIKFPIGENGWAFEHSTLINPYFREDENKEDEIILEKDSKKISIYRPYFSEGGVCTYDEVDFDGPSIPITTYNDFNIDGYMFRSGKIPSEDEERETDMYVVCQIDIKKESFTNDTIFGFITYSVPKDATVEELDLVIQTLKIIRKS